MNDIQRVVFIIIDGARLDVFKRLLDDGRLPGIKEFVVDRGSFFPAKTVFPTVTGPCHFAAVTGRYPGNAGLVGVRWFHRKVYKKSPLSPYAFRSYIGPGSLYLKKDTKQTPSLYSAFPDNSAICSMVQLNEINNLTKPYQIALHVFARLSGKWDIADNIAGKLLLREVKAGRSLVTVTFLGTDELAHLYGAEDDRVFNAYARADKWISRVCHHLQSNGKLESTLLVILSDHGMTTTGKHIDLDAIIEERAGPTLYYPLLTPERVMKAKAAVMTSGNAMSHVYLKHKNGWSDLCTLEEIEEDYPSILDWLEKDERIEATLARTRSGGISICRSGTWKNLSIESDISGSASNGISFDDVNHLFNSPRCGDLLICAHEGYDLRKASREIPEHRASHGGLCDAHMNVPVAISRPIKTAGTARIIDLFPTILRAANKPIPADIDGKPLID